MGIKAREISDMDTFMENMMPRYSAMRNTVRTTSTSWLQTKPRMTSTSEVHRWIISPVEWALCQAKLKCWIWP